MVNKRRNNNRYFLYYLLLGLKGRLKLWNIKESIKNRLLNCYLKIWENRKKKKLIDSSHDHFIFRIILIR